ncbi:LLM class flavin-dependent oxidoreductase [Agromyces italicus]|uniref:LLM class flavin-dependent oxidoreductase n=1 Tax=Agromyces italicus TaxID=279572 RepID=UPI0003B694C3|nr:LLM class flavin-dependent oxidoreductase [Agromyces italicus]
MRARVSFGIIGTTDGSTVAALAPRLERLGFATLWVNDVPGGDSLARLRVAADGTERLHLATGVIPIDRRPVATLDLVGLPAARTTLGIGSGRAERPLGLMRAGIAELRGRSEASVVLGALGPRMRRLAAERADGVLLNWLTPAAAATATAEQHAAAAAYGRSPADGRVVTYVRTIVDEAARPALEIEAHKYERVPAYAANFARLGTGALDATISSAARLADYLADGVADEVVVRAITPTNSLAELERFAETTAEWHDDAVADARFSEE